MGWDFIVGFPIVTASQALPPDQRLTNAARVRNLSSGRENAEMRKQVCDILEGGGRAFKERAPASCPSR